MKVDCVRTPAEFFALGKKWDDLVQKSERDSFFLSWLWLGSWWTHFGVGRDLWVLVARLDGVLVGVAPLCRHSQTFKSLIPYQQLHFMGSGIAAADHLDFILAKGHEDAVTEAFLDFIWLNRAEWDVLYGEGLAEDSFVWQALQARGWGGMVEKVACPYGKMPASWDTYEATLGKNLRKNLKRYNRVLTTLNNDATPFSLAMGKDETTLAFQKLVELHQTVRQSKGDLGAFYGKQMEAFHEDVVEKCRQNNTLRLYTLTIQSKIVAVIYAIKHNGVLSYYATGYDQQYGKYGVGRQLFSFMVAQAIAEGVSELDLLRGDETYKFQWVADKRTDSNVWVGCGWKGKLILSLRQLFTRQAITPLALSAT